MHNSFVIFCATSTILQPFYEEFVNATLSYEYYITNLQTIATDFKKTSIFSVGIFMTNDLHFIPRTDLACESMPTSDGTGSAVGVNICRYDKNGFDIIRTQIDGDEGEGATGKERGTYYTVFSGKTTSLADDAREHLVLVLSEIITELIDGVIDGGLSVRDTTLLVAGLGNRHLSADAVGPLVSDKVTVTRDLRFSDPKLYERLGCACVSTLAPGVAAQTGIEISDILAGACRTVLPHAVILVDAFAARSCSRLATTIQISNTGIAPGSGIGNRRTPVNFETLGVPVITIGIPTIVDSSSLVYDALEEGGISPDKISDNLRHVLENGRSFFVSPKDCDLIVEELSRLVADAINRVAGF